MTRQIFISSAQKELQEFRDAVYDNVTSDPLLNQFSTCFSSRSYPLPIKPQTTFVWKRSR